MKKLSIIAATLAIGLGAPACVIVDDDDGHYDDDHHHYDDGYVGGAVYTTIDADHVLDTDLGEGAGLFVEYAVGGRWTLWTSCDTNVTGSLCFWDVSVVPQRGGIFDPLEFDTEGFDAVEAYESSLRFYAETGSHTDAVEFYADPGALLEITVTLDGYDAPEYLVWFGNGFVHNGANGLPVVFQPDQP